MGTDDALTTREKLDAGYAATAAALYVRVSTDEQARHGYSLETQMQVVRDRAVADGFTIAPEHEYKDAGISGGRSGAGVLYDRPGYLAMLAAAAAGEFGVAFVWKLDRLGRDAEELLRVRRMLGAGGVRIVSVTEGEDESALVYGVRALAAQDEREKISERVRTGKAAAARKGRPNGGRRRFGFKSENGKLIPIPEEVAVAERIFRERVADKKQTAIAKGLNRDGYVTAEGKPWNQPQISQLVKDPVWIGKIKSREGEFDGEHGEVIPAELWEAAQRMGRSGTPRGRRASNFLLGNGMLRCGRCGSSMCVRQEIKNDREYAVYMCYGRTSGSTECDQSVVPRDLIDRTALAYFEEVGLDVNATIAEAEESRDTQLGEIRVIRDHVQAVARKAQDGIDRVNRDYIDGQISAAERRELIEEPQRQLDAASGSDSDLFEREQAVIVATDVANATDEVLDRLTEIRAAIAGDISSAENVEAARAAIRRVFSHFVLHDGRRLPDEPPGHSLQGVPHPEMVLSFLCTVHPDGTEGYVEGSEKVRKVPLPTAGGITASAR